MKCIFKLFNIILFVSVGLLPRINASVMDQLLTKEELPKTIVKEGPKENPEILFDNVRKTCLEICDRTLSGWSMPHTLSFVNYDDPEKLIFFRSILDPAKDQSLTPVFNELDTYFSSSSSIPSFSVLDIGYGWGELASAMLKKYPEISKYYATDIQETVLKNIQNDKKLVAGLFDATDINTFPFKGVEVDVIVSVGAVCYFGEHQERTIQDLSTLLRAGGVMVLVDFLPFAGSLKVGSYDIPRINRFFGYSYLYKNDPLFNKAVNSLNGNVLENLFNLAGTSQRPAYVYVYNKPR